MKNLIRIGCFLIGCGLLCGLVAYERHQQQVRTAEEIAKVMNLDYESVNISSETKVAGFLGVMLFVAGGNCLLNAFSQGTNQGSKPG